MIFPRLSTLLAYAAVASAHVKLVYPPTRGPDEDNQLTPPCGGYNNVSVVRTPFALGKSVVTLLASHHAANVLIMISFVDTPTDIKNFTLTPSGAAQAPLRDFLRVEREEICIGVDVASMRYPNVTEGTNATIAIQYAGGDGELYQCSDVVLYSNATVPSNVTCTDEYQIGATTSGTGTATPSPTGGARVLTADLGFGGLVLASLGTALFVM